MAAVSHAGAVQRPWGWYASLAAGETFQVKLIVVQPGQSLSLQYHRQRSEHWTVVAGVADVVNGDDRFQLTENESTYIPQGQRHRLSNPGPKLLELVEVQYGTYFGEDDIVRLDDLYGRG